MYKKLTCISNNLELGGSWWHLPGLFPAMVERTDSKETKDCAEACEKGAVGVHVKSKNLHPISAGSNFALGLKCFTDWLIEWETKQTNFFWFGLLMGYGIVDDFAAMVDTLCMMRLPLTMLTWLTRQHLGTAISSNSLMSPPASVGKLIPLVTLLFKPTSSVLRLATYSLSASSQLTNFVENFCICGAIFGFLFVLKMLLQNHSALSKFCKMNRCQSGACAAVGFWCLLLCKSWLSRSAKTSQRSDHGGDMAGLQISWVICTGTTNCLKISIPKFCSCRSDVADDLSCCFLHCVLECKQSPEWMNTCYFGTDLCWGSVTSLWATFCLQLWHWLHKSSFPGELWFQLVKYQTRTRSDFWNWF